MSDKAKMKKKIWELDFALHELVLFLDTHPASASALELMKEYRERRRKAVKEYEEAYGPLNETVRKVAPDGVWKWIDGPWPWEIRFTEE